VCKDTKKNVTLQAKPETMYMKRSIIAVLLATIAVGTQAKVRLPHILCDNMILQQQTDARLW
jgi:hypothetical protein